ncbi:MAG: arylsulfatase [Pseudomonadales bacterium]|nr:arylsulfatase [Pseudomonadales bacterium]
MFEDSRPNILLIVLDDAGYSDLGAYGGEIATPHIDKIADEGVIFSQFHVTPTCSSTRASLLSGMDHHRTGLGTHGVTASNQKGKPGYEGYLNNKVISLAETMQAAGYNTSMAGKWHLGSRNKATWPYSRGFNHTFALINGGASHWQDNLPLFPSKPSIYSRNGQVLKKLPDGFYSTTSYTDALIEFIDEDRASGKPFMGYLAFTAPHNPLHAPEKMIAKYADSYTKGWDVLQTSRLQSLKERGLIAKDVKPQIRPQFIPAWNELSKKEQELSARDMAIYAAMIDMIDQNVGRLFDYLHKTGQYKNTAIIIMSDNGPSKTTIADYLSMDKAGKDFIKSFKNALDNRGLPGSSVDLGPGWAYGLAAPFRMMKGYQSQGGILSPLIVKLPQGMQQTDKVIKAPVHVMDIMPTMMALAHITPPKLQSDKLDMQGESLLTLLREGKDDKFVDHGFGGELFGMRYYRHGKWKILLMPKPYGLGEWQLYDLSVDPAEQNDLSARDPDILSRLSSLWQTYANVNGVVEPSVPTAYAKPPAEF